MADYVTLLGTEQVVSAGRQMSSAAETMSQTAMTFDRVAEQQKMFMDDWLSRFEDVLRGHETRLDEIERNRRGT